MSASRKWAVVGTLAAVSGLGIGTAAYAAPTGLNDPAPTQPSTTAQGAAAVDDHQVNQATASADTPAETTTTNTPGDTASADTPGDTDSANTPGDTASATTPGDTDSADTP